MSDSEKFAIQGRAHADLRASLANIATIKARLIQYAKELDDTSQMVRRFIEDPLHVHPDHRVVRSENVKTHLSNILPGDILGLVDELAKEMRSAKEIQEQIDQF